VKLSIPGDDCGEMLGTIQFNGAEKLVGIVDGIGVVDWLIVGFDNHPQTHQSCVIETTVDDSQRSLSREFDNPVSWLGLELVLADLEVWEVVGIVGHGKDFLSKGFLTVRIVFKYLSSHYTIVEGVSIDRHIVRNNVDVLRFQVVVVGNLYPEGYLNLHLHREWTPLIERSSSSAYSFVNTTLTSRGWELKV
jgi:hypothetical protein